MARKQLFRFVKTWFDDSAAHSPLGFNYVVLLSFLLSIVGSWPHKQFGRPRLDFALSIYNLLLVFVAISLTILAAAYIWHKRETLAFFDMGHVLLCVFLEMLFTQRLITARTDSYREIMKIYLLEFHLFYYRNRSLYAEKVYKQIQVISRIFSIIGLCILCFGCYLFIFMPWYNNYRTGMFGTNRPENRTFEQALYYHVYTDDPYTTLKGYWILFSFNIPTTINTSIGVLSFDLLLSLIVFQILGHIKIMKYNLLSIPTKAGMYSLEENMRVRESLKEIIDHHKIIIRFVNKCSETFSEYLFAFYFLMQFITIVELLEMTTFTAETIAKYGPVTLSIYQQLIIVSILFEMISTKSEQLAVAVYEMPWQCMDTKNRRTVLILLGRAQTPITLKAAKMVPVGVRTMSSVLKTTVSYFMILRTVAKERGEFQPSTRTQTHKLYNGV